MCPVDEVLSKVLRSVRGGTRQLARFEQGEILVSTVECYADEPPFETAIEHPAYGMVAPQPVELYATAEEARAGHARWVARIEAGDLPVEIDDPRYLSYFGERRTRRRAQ